MEYYWHFFAEYNINFFSKLPKVRNFYFSLEFYLQCKDVWFVEERMYSFCDQAYLH